MTGLLDSLPLLRALFRIILCSLLLIIAASASEEDLGSWLERGHSALENGSYREAVNFFDRAIKIDGGNASAWGGKGAALSRLGRYKMAEMCLGMALKKEGANANYWLEDGWAKEMGERWSEAIKSYDKALSLNKSLVHAWLGLANSSLALKEYEDAQQFYRKAQGQGLAQASREGLLNALLAESKDALDRGSFDEAYSISSEALALAPQDLRFMEIQCSALVGRNEVEKALTCYDQMQSAGHSSEQAIAARSLLLTDLGKKELSAGNVSLALERLDAALHLDPHNQEAAQFQAKALSQKGDLLFEQGQYDLAAESYDAALD
ncbi:MAG TPA: tetratricopeptide repeat protein, partial [Methanothrix sp.]|nr:tetratricopeptide repeat protein [Methanothrix sp.]